MSLEVLDEIQKEALRDAENAGENEGEAAPIIEAIHDASARQIAAIRVLYAMLDRL